jgi:ComF family protein
MTFEHSANVRDWGRRLGRNLLDLLFPGQCLRCKADVAEPRTLCAECWSKIRFIDGPMCPLCGTPYDSPLEMGLVCAACLAEPPPYTMARSVFRYDDASRDLVLAFKHADRLEGAPAFASWLARSGRELLDRADFIAPVPLHWRRLVRRRYNQAAILANALSEKSGVPALSNLLLRKRATASQGEMRSRRARKLNVAGAFTLNPRHAVAIKDRHILLVDDVLTTGATVTACVRLLRRSGAREVAVMTLARVVRQES